MRGGRGFPSGVSGDDIHGSREHLDISSLADTAAVYAKIAKKMPRWRLFWNNRLTMELPFLKDLFVLFGLSMAALYGCSLIRIPSLVGFLLTGMAAGPFGMKWIEQVHEVEALAEFGVILLLFAIGIEFSIEHIARMKRTVLLGGSIQVLLTIFLAYLAASQWGLPFGQAIFIGFLLSLSSTAIVLKIFLDKAEIASPHSGAALSILIFQDIVIVPMILAVPLLAGGEEHSAPAIVWTMLKGLFIIAAVFLSARYWMPALLFQIAKTRIKELFLLTVITFCLGVAWLTSSLGLSLGLGAFLAGLIISESEYSLHALGGILPFRELFLSFFFISVGMLLNLHYFFANLLFLAALTFLVMGIKSVIGFFSILLAGLPLRVSILAGLAVSQIGEFSFVLSQAGMNSQIITETNYQIFLAVAILSMMMTPFMMEKSPKLAQFALRLPLPEIIKSGLGRQDWEAVQAENQEKKDHLIIVGFGLIGKNLARAARMADIPYVVVEMNPETVKRERAGGEPIFYGDAAQTAVLEHAGVKAARILAIVIADPAAARRITSLAREKNPSLFIVVRTRFLSEMKPLIDLGADEVIPEEYETSIEIFTRVLTKYLVSRDRIDRFVHEIRSGGYEMLRQLQPVKISMSDVHFHLSEMEIAVIRLSPSSPLLDRTLAQSEIRKKHGATLVAIRRGGKLYANPSIDMVFQLEDELILLGKPEQISDFNALIEHRFPQRF
ncbi:MAG: cation:proton antiporter [Candidatus Omnitrophota bacterium]